MVKFNEKGYSIEVDTALSPHENYIETMEELIDLFQSEAEDMRANRFYSMELLKAMLPSREQAKAMASLDENKVRQIHEDYKLTCCK